MKNRMPNKARKRASNIEINKGSILLLFDEMDAIIVRNWRRSAAPEQSTDPPPAGTTPVSEFLDRSESDARP